MISDQIHNKYKECRNAITLYIIIISVLFLLQETIICYADKLNLWFSNKLPVSIENQSFDIALLALTTLSILYIPTRFLKRNKNVLMAIWLAFLSYYLLEVVSLQNFQLIEMKILPISYLFYLVVLTPLAILLKKVIIEVYENYTARHKNLLLKDESNSDSIFEMRNLDSFSCWGFVFILILGQS